MKQSLKKVSSFGVVAFGAAILVACSNHSNDSTDSDKQAGSGQDPLVECYGVAQKDNAPLIMSKGMCDKLPSTKQVPVNTSDYVQCYGVAAAGQNDCATKTSSCAGSAKVARASDAWVSLPLGVCENLKGAVIGKATDDKAVNS